MAKEENKLSPIAKMIDQSTGYYKQKLKIVTALDKRFNKLRKLLEGDK